MLLTPSLPSLPSLPSPSGDLKTNESSLSIVLDEFRRKTKMVKPALQSLPFLLLLLLLFFFSFCSIAIASGPHLTHSPLSSNLSMPSEALPLLAFKLKADPNNRLLFSPFPTSSPFHFCKHWPGVQCIGQKVVRLVLHNLDLGGVFAPNTLSLLDQLRVLSLQNNSLSGPIPDLSGLVNLKSLFLDHNHFTGALPPSVLTLHRLRTLDLSHNNFSGPLPTSFSTMERFYYLRLDGNRFTGSIPPLNQSALLTFNVSNNNLTGAIPVTPTLLRFEPSSFASNPGLCGEIIHKECHPSPPFFVSSIPAPPPAVSLGQSAEVHRPVDNLIAQPYKRKRNRIELIIGFCSGVFVLVCSLLCFMMAAKRQRQGSKSEKYHYSSPAHTMAEDAAVASETAAAMQMEQSKELEEKVKKVQGMQMEKSGSLIFCAGEAQLYSLDQLMRASAELMGRGTIGTTYKAVLDNRLIVSVKRLDATKMERSTTKEVFDRHMESVGGLRHPNLVPLRAYFQAKEERLLVYDYQPNGSLFSLIHGSKSSKARPLHWTSCLKIAEDVAQGLSYIHQAWRLVHGNLKSSNVLLGPDFEACITDYCLSVLANPSNIEENPDCAAYRAPENRNSHCQPSPKSDVYAFGVLLLELLTGKTPSQHPVLGAHDMVRWVKSVRNDDCGDESRMGMLLELASACCVASPDLRPTMWLVLKMLQEIKATVLAEDIQN